MTDRTRWPRPLYLPDGAAAGASADSSTTTAADDAGADDGSDDGSLFAGIEDTPAQDANGKPVRPDFVPEQFWDADKGEVKVEALAKSQRDLRAQISRGEHKPPATAEAYTVPPVEGMPEGTIGGKDDKLWPVVRQAAHAAGVTQAQLNALATPLLAEAARLAKERGATATPDPAAAQAAREQALEAERAKLGPNAKVLVRDLGAWIDGLANKGVFTAEETRAVKALGNAAGVRALMKLRELAGEKSIPLEAIGGDSMTQADAQKMLTAGIAKGDEGMQRRARQHLEDMERQGLLRPI